MIKRSNYDQWLQVCQLIRSNILHVTPRVFLLSISYSNPNSRLCLELSQVSLSQNVTLKLPDVSLRKRELFWSKDNTIPGNWGTPNQTRILATDCEVQSQLFYNLWCTGNY